MKSELKAKLLKNNLMEKPKPLTFSYCVLSQLYVLTWKICILASNSRISPYTTLSFLEGKLENKECFFPLHTHMIQDSILNTVRLNCIKWLNRMEHFQVPAKVH